MAVLFPILVIDLAILVEELEESGDGVRVSWRIIYKMIIIMLVMTKLEGEVARMLDRVIDSIDK